MSGTAPAPLGEPRTVLRSWGFVCVFSCFGLVQQILVVEVVWILDDFGALMPVLRRFKDKQMFCCDPPKGSILTAPRTPQATFFFGTGAGFESSRNEVSGRQQPRATQRKIPWRGVLWFVVFSQDYQGQFLREYQCLKNVKRLFVLFLVKYSKACLCIRGENDVCLVQGF